MAFKIAGSMAFKEGFMKAKPILLEPVMKVEVEVPEEFMGDVIGDISSRRGQIEGMETIDKLSKVRPRFRFPRCSVMPLTSATRLVDKVPS